jgi:hypothetical protein
MPLVIDATVGGASSNSYETLAEAQTYFDSRLSLDGWDNADSQAVLLVMATRLLDALAQPFKTLVPAQGGEPAYYRVRRQWTGLPATATQRLAWPRINMLDSNGNVIPSTVIPQELKDAESEFAGQLGLGDRSLDNDVIIQGLTSLRAGPISLAFKNNIIAQVIPDAVYNLLPASWLTDELVLPAFPALFDIIGSRDRCGW